MLEYRAAALVIIPPSMRMDQLLRACLTSQGIGMWVRLDWLISASGTVPE